MPTYAELLDRLTFTVTSPDGAITARFHDRRCTDLTFRPGAYDFYSEQEPALARQLAALAQLGFVARRRAALAALSTAIGHEVTGREEPGTPERRAYEEARAALTTKARSPDGRIAVGTRGWLDWRVTIAEGTTEAIEEDEFARQADAAIRALIAEYRRQCADLRERLGRTTTVPASAD